MSATSIGKSNKSNDTISELHDEEALQKVTQSEKSTAPSKESTQNGDSRQEDHSSKQQIPKKLVWSNIEATVAVKKTKAKDGSNSLTKRPVIKGVSGVARPGELLALMGGSGAGKTTLMNILAKLKTKGVEHTGSVTVNGIEQTETEMRRQSAYVQQIDLFCGTLTVREQLMYSALMRMNRRLSLQEKMKKVEEVIVEMNLQECEGQLIGVRNKIKGIPFGEKKRLAFACEVLTDPDILFCDEPTSGLDAFMATQVTMALRLMANKGKTVISVIHQPSTSIFLMFDEVCFMADGRIAYQGPVAQMCDFFESFNDPLLHIPPSHNPADFVISQVAIRPHKKEEDLKKIERIITHFEQHPFGIALKEEVDKVHSVQSQILQKSKSYASSFYTQFRVLFMRAFKNTLRDPVLMRVKLIQITVTGLIVGIVNFQTDLSGSTVQNIEGILFNCVRDMNFLFLFPSINAITSELPLFYREHKAQIYSTPAYFLAKSLAELPEYTILPFIYSLIVYWMTGLLPNAVTYILFNVTCILTCYTATSIAQMGACMFGDEGNAVTYVPLFALPMLVFGGFYINTYNVPVYFTPFTYVSWFKYGFEVLEANHWNNIKHIPCKTGEYCPGKNGYELLERRGIENTKIWLWLVILLFGILIYRCLALGALMVRVRYVR